MAAATQYSMMSAFLSAFALALGADSLYIGLLSAVPVALWTIALLPSALLCQKNMVKRKWIVVASATAARLMWIPIILIALWFAASSLALGMLLVFVTLATLVGAVSTPAWASIAGDLVPESSRGRYFSKRTVATTAAGLTASLAAGWILDIFGKNDTFGFAVIFTIGLGFGLLSSLLFSRIPSPPIMPSKDFHGAAIRDVWRDARFRTFLILFGIWQFGIMFSAPFLNIYILKTLAADYIWISIVIVAGGVAGILVQRGWGVFSDRYGHRVMMIIAAFGTVPSILLWIPATSAWMLVPIEIFSGMIWAGITIAHYNYMLEISPSRARPVFAAMFNVVLGIAGIFGPIAAGLTAQHFATQTFLGLSEYRVVFLISGIIRLVGAILFLKFLAEVVEKRERVKPGYVFGEMLKYGVQGGIFKAHHAAGGFVSDASTVEQGLKGAAKLMGKDIAVAAHAIGGVVERAAVEADKKGDRISESGWPKQDEKKSDEKTHLRVNVSD
jgi:MFS family permease